MTDWSLHLLNGIETVFRGYAYAREVQQKIDRDASGQGLTPGPWQEGCYGPAPGAKEGIHVGVHRWWLKWYEPKGREQVKAGGTKVAPLFDSDGTPILLPIGLVQVCFWHDRKSDRIAPVLRPQVICGAGTISLHEWGSSHEHKKYLEQVADRINIERRTWESPGPKGRLPDTHATLRTDWEWLDPLALEDLDSQARVAEVAQQFADHMTRILPSE